MMGYFVPMGYIIEIHFSSLTDRSLGVPFFQLIVSPTTRSHLQQHPTYIVARHPLSESSTLRRHDVLFPIPISTHSRSATQIPKTPSVSVV
jgi:hypothetical protein